MKNNRLYISVPVNISRFIVNDLKKICPDAEVTTSSKRYYAEDLELMEKIRAGRIEEVPELIVTIRPELHGEKKFLAKTGVFDSGYRYQADSFIESKGFMDDQWIMKPIFIMPLIIFYNRALKNPPASWEDLLEPRFKGKILATNEMTPPASLLKLFYIHHFKEAGKDFIEKNLNYKGLPVDVNRAVAKGEFDIGIMPLTFAKFSKDNNASYCWPAEGALPLPQVMLLKKDFSEDAKKAADYLISKKTQEFLSQKAGFIPIIPDVLPPRELKENQMNLLWNGWEAFIDMAAQER